MTVGKEWIGAGLGMIIGGAVEYLPALAYFDACKADLIADNRLPALLAVCGLKALVSGVLTVSACTLAGYFAGQFIDERLDDRNP